VTAAYFMEVDGQPAVLQGYCAIYGTPSDSIDANYGRRLLIRPGAFDEVLSSSCRPTVDFAHLVSGRIGGSLSLWSDSTGLAFELCDIPATGAGPKVVRLIARGEVRGMSLAGNEESENALFEGEPVRAISRFVTLDHVAPTGGPMFGATGVWLSTATYLDGHRSRLRDSWERGRRIQAIRAAPHGRKGPSQILIPPGLANLHTRRQEELQWGWRGPRDLYKRALLDVWQQLNVEDF
jgi:phage head maturation protease